MRLPSAAKRAMRSPAGDGRGRRLPRDPSVRGEGLVDRGRQLGERVRHAGPADVGVEVALAHRGRVRRGTSRPCRAAGSRTRGYPAATISASTGYGIRRAGAAVRDRLDDRVAESLPRRGEHDEIAGRVRVGRGRRPPERHRERRPLDDAVEHGRVAVLGRARRSRGAAGVSGASAVQLLREPERAGNVLALDRARRLEQHEVVVDEAELLAGRGAVAGRRVEVEVVVDRRPRRRSPRRAARGGCGG